jgi:hypothetical protein
MNQQQFDRIARRFATAVDRRALLRAAVATMVAHALGGLGRVAAGQEVCPDGCAEDEICTDRGCVTPCTRHPDCRNKYDDPCVSNRCIDGVCVTAIVECLPGSACFDGECFPTSCELDTDCAVFDPCRWGRCGVDGRCEFIDLDPCVICAGDEECLGSGQNTVCCDGACRRPCPAGTLMGKGCECHAYGSTNLDGVVVHDDASG